MEDVGASIFNRDNNTMREATNVVTHIESAINGMVGFRKKMKAQGILT